MSILPGISFLCQIVRSKDEPFHALADRESVYDLGHVRGGDPPVKKVVWLN